MSGHADEVHGYLNRFVEEAHRAEALAAFDALVAEIERLRKLLEGVLPHLDGGHDEARIWAQNVRKALRSEQ